MRAQDFPLDAIGHGALEGVPAQTALKRQQLIHDPRAQIIHMAAKKRIQDLIIVKVGKRVNDFGKRVAQAGFFPEAEYDTPGADGTSVAYVATIQEYGDPSHHIPPRPFMRKASQSGRDQWMEDVARGVRAVARGQRTPIAVLDAIGGAMAADIQDAIAATDSPALSPITVMLRGMRRNDSGLVVTGRTVGEAARRVDDEKTNYGASDKPLVDTGLMLSSVTHKVGRRE